MHIVTKNANNTLTSNTIKWTDLLPSISNTFYNVHTTYPTAFTAVFANHCSTYYKFKCRLFQILEDKYLLYYRCGIKVGKIQIHQTRVPVYRCRVISCRVVSLPTLTIINCLSRPGITVAHTWGARDKVITYCIITLALC